MATTLTELLGQRRDVLLAQLRQARNSSQAAAVVSDELRRLSATGGEYIPGLSVPQARLAMSMLESFQMSFDALAAAQSQVDEATPGAARKGDDQGKESRRPLPLSALGGAVSAAAVGSFAGGPFGFLLGGMIGSLVGTAIAMTQPPPIQAPAQSNGPAVTQPINAEGIVSCLEQAYAVIDRMVAEFGARPSEVRPVITLDLMPDTLEFLQGLLGDAASVGQALPDTLALRLKQVPTLLRHSGIRAEYYRPGATTPEQAQLWFELEPSLDPEVEHYVSTLPALLKGDDVLLRGRVIVPAQATGV